MGMDFIIGATTGMKEGTRTVTFTVVSITFEKRTSDLSIYVLLLLFPYFASFCMLACAFY